MCLLNHQIQLTQIPEFSILKIFNSLKRTTIYQNKNLSEILEAQEKSTQNIFRKKNIPFRSFNIKKKDENTLGELFCFCVLETILLGHALKVNPLDQPSVELIKTETKRLLSKL